MICAIILCGGNSERIGSNINKIYAPVAGKTVLNHTLAPFSELVDFVILACRKQDFELANAIAKAGLDIPFLITEGGKTRLLSVYNALMAVPQDCDTIVIHDGARCLVSSTVISDCIKSAQMNGSGIAAVKCTDTIRMAENGLLTKVVERENIVCIQTPQAFQKDLIMRAYENAIENEISATDDSTLVSKLNIDVKYVSSDYSNIKITTPADLDYIRYVLEKHEQSTGFGFDSHAFSEGNGIILGGVDIPCDKKLLGHSDADVLVHAIIDSLLGAAGLPDIGEQFPDTSNEFLNISSIELLSRVSKMLKDKNITVCNIDSTVILNSPKLSNYKLEMAQNIAKTLGIHKSYVNVKAKTAEGLKNGDDTVSAFAVCLVKKYKH